MTMLVLATTLFDRAVRAFAPRANAAPAQPGSRRPSPEHALRMRARAEAEEVRAMAYAYRHDPNFASELRAAADRHEQQVDERLTTGAAA